MTQLDVQLAHKENSKSGDDYWRVIINHSSISFLFLFSVISLQLPLISRHSDTLSPDDCGELSIWPDCPLPSLVNDSHTSGARNRSIFISTCESSEPNINWLLQSLSFARQTKSRAELNHSSNGVATSSLYLSQSPTADKVHCSLSREFLLIWFPPSHADLNSLPSSATATEGHSTLHSMHHYFVVRRVQVATHYLSAEHQIKEATTDQGGDK